MSDKLILAVFKTLLILVSFIGAVCVGGGMVIYFAMFFTDFVVAHNLGLVLVVPFVLAILALFGLHVNYIYKEMLK